MLGSLNLTTFNLDFLQPLIGELNEAKSILMPMYNFMARCCIRN